MTPVLKSETISVFGIGRALKIANFSAKFSAIFFAMNFAKIFADENLHKYFFAYYFAYFFRKGRESEIFSVGLRSAT